MAAGDAADDPQLPVAFVGDSGVGKTCIVRRWALDQFSSMERPNIAPALACRAVDIGGQPYSVIVSDTPGDPAYRSAVGACVYKAKVVAIVFSVTSRDTFFALPTWVDTVTKAPVTSKMVLVGNKTDLATDRQVSAEQATDYAAQLGCPFFETSARRGMR